MSKQRHDYKNLKIWTLGLEMVNDVFDLFTDFPKDEKYGLQSQISRCSISIPSNIAEGSSRSDKTFSNYIDIALGSSFELETQLIIACNRNYINQQKLNDLQKKISEFQKMTMSFQNKFE
ncbi:four helix bundle protein [Flavobacteriaceae bacterium MAR_2010_188]|nr:four helix bundle protein [Flavobacteriaceae bacterium MAR_2010_188]